MPLKRTSLMSLAALALLTSAAVAQVPNAQPPFNTPMTNMIPAATRAASTVLGALQANVDKTGVRCRLTQANGSSSSGSPSTTFGIQTYDVVSGRYLQQAVSGAITTAQDNEVIVYPGAVATSVPSATAIFGIPLGNAWRVFMTIAGTGDPRMTASVDCGYLR